MNETIKAVGKSGSGYSDCYGMFAGRLTQDTPIVILGDGRYPIESKVKLPSGATVLLQKRFIAEVTA